MRKIISKIAGLMLGLSLAAGVGVFVSEKDKISVHADTESGTINFGSASGSTKVNSTSVTGDDSLGNTWTITTVMNQTSFTQNAAYSQIGASSKPATSITFTTTLDAAQTISSFSAKFGGFSGTAGTITLKVGNTSVGTGSLSATNDVVVNATNTTTSGTVLTVTVTGISKGVKAYYISYAYETGGGQSNTYSVIYNKNETESRPVLNMPSNHTGLEDSSTQVLGGTPTRWGYSFLGWGLTADATSYVNSVTINGANVDVYAIWGEDHTVSGAWSNKPYTVAQARAAIDAGSHLSENYVAGTISQIDSYSSNYKSIQYWISDDGTTTNQLECYSGKGLHGADFSSQNDIVLKADVVVCGTLKKYNSTYEFDKNNYQISYSYIPPTVLSVSYDANGGSGTLEDNNTYSSGDSVEVLANTFAAPSNLVEFKEFNTERDGSGDGYSPGDDFEISDNVTLYAIWQPKAATLSDGTYTAVLSYSNPISNLVDVKISDTAYTCLSVTSSGLTYDDNNNSFKLSKDGSIEFVNNSNAKIVKAVVNVYKYNNFDLYEDGSSTATYNGAGSQIDTGNIDVEITTDASSSIKVVCNGGSASYNQSLASITLTLEVSTPKVLSSISVSGAESSFDVGDAFTYNDLVVTAHYDNGSSATVTPTSVSSPDMSTAGSKTVTVSYTEGEVTETAQYTIQVNAVTKYTVSFLSGGGSGSMASVEVKEGSDYTLPECSFDAPEGKRFAGWTLDGSSIITVLENVTDDVEITATWEDAPAETNLSYIFSEHYSEDTELEDTSIDLDSLVSARFVKGGSNATKYYANGTAVRWYAAGTLTISCDGGNITAITLRFSGKHDNSVSTTVGTYTDISTASGDGEWVGISDSVVFTQSGSSGHDRISQIDVTYVMSGTLYTITYNANGGSETMSPTVGAHPVVAACTFTNEGFSFARWNTQADGEGDDYEVGTSLSESITLYAIWQEYIEPIGADVTMDGVSSASTATITTLSGIERAGLKCGTSKVQGSMSLTLNKAGITKIKVYVACWNGSSENTAVDVSTSTEGVTVLPSTLSLTKDSCFTGNTSAFTLTGAETLYKQELTISSDAPAGTIITISAQKAADNRFIVWGATNLFAETFADEFSSNLTCDASGETGPSFGSEYSWASFKSIYDGLDEEEQARLRSADYTISGSGSSTVVTAKEGTEQAVAEAVAKYDYIVAKYGTANYANFINRSITPLAGAPYLLPAMNNNNTSTIVIVVVALTSISSIGVLLVIKRKRSLVK